MSKPTQYAPRRGPGKEYPSTVLGLDHQPNQLVLANGDRVDLEDYLTRGRKAVTYKDARKALKLLRHMDRRAMKEARRG